MRSIHSRRATLSPSNAFLTAVWIDASAWPCNSLSTAMVALLGEPFGLPELHAENLPVLFLPFFVLYIIPNT